MATIFDWPTDAQYQSWAGMPQDHRRRQIKDAERQRNHDATMLSIEPTARLARKNLVHAGTETR